MSKKTTKVAELLDLIGLLDEGAQVWPEGWENQRIRSVME